MLNRRTRQASYLEFEPHHVTEGPLPCSARSRPPQHPWSVGNPRMLPSALTAQPQVAVMSSADAASPVPAAAAAGPADAQGTTAILPRRSLDGACSPFLGHDIPLVITSLLHGKEEYLHSPADSDSLH